ncbi:conserved exported hypothetical protein [Cupriavidus taiwanensis]|uniref:MetA-pathway of phenol degradation n=1 Tax=Cupriavidus taiwanensis TaxID=164546 RepID=A0A976G471_9BURK|nr:hypothetical protein [Cupriavidus taiwanensis]SOZ17768.1 conserved exported hypothetical protein [Cupriavidus taiwanensis]SOZ30355.1 conserved exported hypothetical protein [Cupriavidus taiwanensis]SOZ49623.1 conserved exported hypothetical protein [Cupriavidus taiwanensis]SOZ64684.1 conserved exported hypothetical protein [Cupriavidus taiwanensis]SOZ65596.1 conserved exported hypothetical protein [Cupriavidus taiwanensis]
MVWHQFFVRVAALAIVAAAGRPALAARPLITDDARIVDPKACQLESWMQFQSGGNELWALPGCNPTGNLELTLGGSLQRVDGGWDGTNVQFQAKTLLKPLETNGYGIALSGGVIHHPDTEPGKVLGNLYVNVPVSFSFADDRFVAHLNLGANRDTGNRQTRMTWGAGTETQLHPRVFLIAETFGENRGKPSFQAGFRFWVVQDRVQVDTTYGNVFGGGTGARFFTVGLRLLSPAFLP